MSAKRGYMQWGCGLLIAGLAAACILGISFPRFTYRLLATRLTKAQLVAELGGEQVAAVLRAYDRVDSALIEPPDNESMHQPHEYVELDKPQPIAGELAANISRILLITDVRKIYPEHKGLEELLARWRH